MFAIPFMYICLLYWVFVFGLRFLSRAWSSGYIIRPVMGRFHVRIFLNSTFGPLASVSSLAFWYGKTSDTVKKQKK